VVTSQLHLLSPLVLLLMLLPPLMLLLLLLLPLLLVMMSSTVKVVQPLRVCNCILNQLQ
jgi:hypothetical protein